MTQPDIEQGISIGLDWGTSAARAFAFGRQGSVLAMSAGAADQPLGVQRLHASLGRTPVEADFAGALESLLADLWLTLFGETGRFSSGVPIVACGMIGSQQGLKDAGYLPCPADPVVLGARLVPARCGVRTLKIVPGLSMPGAGLSALTGVESTTSGRPALPDVMRGEETQILGALTQRGEAGRLMVFPGSHSKWVQVRGGLIESFETQFTGELYAALSTHTILGRLFSEHAPPLDREGFDAGLSLARLEPGQLQRHLFSVRALGLSGSLSPGAGPSFLSGLLIGHELASALPRHQPQAAVDIVGSDALCERYALALEAFGLSSRRLGNTSARGLSALLGLTGESVLS